MASAVIDASAAIAWLFGEEGVPFRIRQDEFEGRFTAPWLWRIEMVNALLVKERRKLITHAQSLRLFRIVDALRVDVRGEPPHRTMEQLAQVARPHQLSAYDAVYLELAMNSALPLFTVDRNLQHAATRTGIPLWGTDLRG